MIAWLNSLLDSWRIRNAEIDPNSKCPGCGHRNGKLKCEMVATKEKPNVTAMIEHTCQVCHAVWHEPTVLRPDKWVPAELMVSKG